MCAIGNRNFTLWPSTALWSTCVIADTRFWRAQARRAVQTPFIFGAFWRSHLRRLGCGHRGIGLWPSSLVHSNITALIAVTSKLRLLAFRFHFFSRVHNNGWDRRCATDKAGRNSIADQGAVPLTQSTSYRKIRRSRRGQTAFRKQARTSDTW